MSALLTTALRILFLAVVLSGLGIGGYMILRQSRVLLGCEVSD